MTKLHACTVKKILSEQTAYQIVSLRQLKVNNVNKLRQYKDKI